MFTGSIFTRSKKTVASLGVLVAAFGLVSVSTITIVKPAYAAPADAAVPQFGVIDYDKVVDSSKSRQQAEADLHTMQQTMTAIMKRLTQGSVRFLSAAEINELAGLYEKAKPTDVELKRISQLEEKSDGLRREMTTLQNTPSPTEAQTARMTVLTDLQTQGDNSLKDLDTTLFNRLKDKAQNADQETITQIKTAVAKVAKSKNLSVVFMGNAALYVTIDVTDDVIKELNK